MLFSSLFLKILNERAFLFFKPTESAMKSTAVSTSDRHLIICWYGFRVRHLRLGVSFTCIRDSAEEIRLSLMTTMQKN